MGTKLTVLLADDDIIILRLFQSFFATFNCQVTCARNGDEAARYLADTNFDLVLTDLQMGSTSGLDVIRCSKSTSNHTVTFLMTGTHDPNHAEEAYAAGADEVFFKPVSLTAITKELVKYGIQLEKRRLQKSAERKPQTSQESLHLVAPLLSENRAQPTAVY